MTTAVALIVQARAGGSRFPGKVLAPILGQPMLLWQLDRLSYVPSAPTIIVATPPGDENRPLWDLCERHGYQSMAPPCDEEDVLARYAMIADDVDAAHVIRVTGDCPLLDPLVVEAVWQTYHHSEMAGYLGIADQWPDGQDCEVFSRHALAQAAADATRRSDREHVTPYIQNNPDLFPGWRMACPFDYAQVQYSVDTSADLAGVERTLFLAMRDWPITMIGYREIGAVIRADQTLQEWQKRRQPRNHKYLAQVAQERDAAYRGPRIHTS